jgi:NAD(P)-dependent dehydrogenase (short-subunit alcohol dehydrogenase family)
MKDMYRLDGKVAIITGASRGIGEAMAKGFAARGAKVVVSSRKLADLEKVAGEINAAGGIAKAIDCHTGKLDNLGRLVKGTLDAFGRVDILINNAATNPLFGPCIQADEKAWEKIFEVNLKGYFFLSKEVAQVMGDQGGGCIINVSSVAGLTPGMGLGVYSISKAGVLMLTKVLAQEWASMKIRVNSIAPGIIDTKMSAVLIASPEIVEEAMRPLAIKRIGKPEDIVGAAIYLASDEASYMTGQTLIIDGGGYMA